MADDPAYITAFKKLTKGAPRIEDIQPMEREFYGENDRASGILFGGWVDLALESAIKSALRPDLTSTLATRLFDFDGPIGTFSARINLGFALAIFGQKTKHDLDLIRLIRNEFAHCRLPLRFDLPEVSKVCEHFQILETDQRADPFEFVSLPKAYEMMENPEDENHPKQKFIICCHSIAFGLLTFAHRKDRRELQKSTLP